MGNEKLDIVYPDIFYELNLEEAKGSYEVALKVKETILKNVIIKEEE